MTASDSLNPAANLGGEGKEDGGKENGGRRECHPYPEYGGRLGDGDEQYPMRDQRRWGRARA